MRSGSGSCRFFSLAASLRHATRLMTYGKTCMVQLDQLASAARDGDALTLRSLVQDFLRDHQTLSNCPRPISSDGINIAIAAGLIELLASRRSETAPIWTKDVPA